MWGYKENGPTRGKAGDAGTEPLGGWEGREGIQVMSGESGLGRSPDGSL